MKIKDLSQFLYDNIIVYRNSNNSNAFDFEDLFKGYAHEMPIAILDMDIISVNAKKKKVLEIYVR